MAHNNIVLTTVSAQTVNTVTKEFTDGAIGVTNNNRGYDIFYHLGTNLEQSAWSNPNGGAYLNVTNGGTWVTTENITARDLNPGTYNAGGASTHLTFELLTGFEMNIQLIRFLTHSSSAFVPETRDFFVSSDGVTFDRVLRVVNQGAITNTWYNYVPNSLEQDWVTHFRATFDNSSSAAIQIGEIELYGKLRNLTTGVAGFKIPGDRFENLLNVDTKINRLDRAIYWDESSNIWESRHGYSYDIDSRVLTEDVFITRPEIRSPRYYILSPNGVNRNVYIPAPQVNDTFKIRSLDGLYDVSIYEQDVTQLDNGLRNYWHFENNLFDSRGNLNLGLSAGGSSVVYQAGLQGQESVYNGFRYQSTSTQGTFNTPSGSFTFSCWASITNKTFSGNDRQALLSHYDTSANRRGPLLAYNEVSDKFEFTTTQDGTAGTQVTVSSTTSPVLSTRYLITCTYNTNSGDMNIWINDELEATAQQATGGVYNPGALQDFWTGRSSATSYAGQLHGTLDAIGIWTREHSQSDVDLNYNGGAATTHALISGTPPTPVVLNNAGKLQYEYVYDGTEWHLLG